MELSKRLQAVADLLDCHEAIADIGCDHGFVSIYLIESKKAKRCLAMDVNIGPLERAKEHVIEKRLSTYIETRLSDGAKEIRFVTDQQGIKRPEVQAALIAGMGGKLMIRIIQDSLNTFRGMEEFVLQPQSELARVRQFLKEIGCYIYKEEMVWEDGKYYPIMKVNWKPIEPDWSTDIPENIKQRLSTAEEKKEVLQKLYDEYGEHLLKGKHPVLLQYLKKEKELYQTILENLEQTETSKSERRQIEIKEKMIYINLGLEWFGDEV